MFAKSKIATTRIGINMKDYDPNDAIDFIFKTAPLYAKAKGELAQFEAFRHSLKAIEMSKSEATTIGGKEMDAYKSQPYQELCEAIGLATEEAEGLRWQLEAAKMRFEAWRTQEASNRNIERLTK
jgi:hypothetical protein